MPHQITTIERRRIDPHKLYGRILKKSKDFTLLAVVDDFIFDGFQIVRNKDISKQTISDSNKYCAKLMKKEGTWVTKLPKGLLKLDLTSWGSILSGIKSDVVILEDEKKDEFSIGPVVSVTSKTVTLHWFDGVGKWGDAETIKYSGITTCKFMDRYSATHAKYLKWQE